MTVQPECTPAQQAVRDAIQAWRDETQCPTCAADDEAAPSRYCASKACVCVHEDCPAFPNTPPRRDPWNNVTAINKES